MMASPCCLPAAQQFNHTAHQYEIRLERASVVEPQAEDEDTQAIPQVQFNVSRARGVWGFRLIDKPVHGVFG